MYDFAANAVVENLDSVPEEFKGAYAQIGEGDNKGKYGITPHAKGLVDAYTGVNTRLNQVSKDKTTAGNESAKRRLALKALSEVLTENGIEIDAEAEDAAEKARAALGELTAKVKGGKELQVNLDKIRQDSAKQIAEKEAVYKAENQKMRASLEDFMIGQQAATFLAEAKVVQNGVDLLMPQIKQYAKVMATDEGKYVVRVVDDQGDVRSDGKGGWLSIKDFVGELKGRFPTAFQSDAKGGGGAKPNETGKTKTAVAGDNEKSAQQKILDGLRNRGK